jgi:hypothetical protein
MNQNQRGKLTMAIQLTEEHFKSGRPVSQGEVNFWMEKYAPQYIKDNLKKLKNFTKLELENGELILGHSETGHHHIIEPVNPNHTFDEACAVYFDAANDIFAELEVFQECKVVHLRKNDTHQAYILPPGKYIKGLREESTIDGWRKVAD